MTIDKGFSLLAGLLGIAILLFVLASIVEVFRGTQVIVGKLNESPVRKFCRRCQAEGLKSTLTRKPRIAGYEAELETFDVDGTRHVLPTRFLRDWECSNGHTWREWDSPRPGDEVTP